jgi:hypothetical protein
MYAVIVVGFDSSIGCALKAGVSDSQGSGFRSKPMKLSLPKQSGLVIPAAYNNTCSLIC